MKVFGQYIILIMAWLLSCYPVTAQKAKQFTEVDKFMLGMPDASAQNPEQIAGFITGKFTSQEEIIRAVFIWVAGNISYDIENMYSVNFYENIQQVVNQTLESRKGVCMGYAHLFEAIATAAGIRSYVTGGYTKQNGSVDYLPHAWCAAEIDTVWYLFDPTWGAGYLMNEEFIPEINNKYFMARPEDLIKTHMPFDPLWQFLDFPVYYQEFNRGNFNMATEKKYFDYRDTLSVYERQDEISRLISENNRIMQNGTRNALVFDRLQHNQQTIEYFINKDQVEKYNTAISHYNDGIAHLNRFINYRNNQFTPKIPDNEILEMVAAAERSLNNAALYLTLIEKPDRDLSQAMLQLSGAIEEARINLREQQAFLDKYYSTGKASRRSLFYRYTWMGIPVK